MPFQLFFQPKIDTQTDHLIGHEILLRNKSSHPAFPETHFHSIIASKETHAEFLHWLKKELLRLLTDYPKHVFALNFYPEQLLYLETQLLLKELTGYRDVLIIEITEDIFIHKNQAREHYLLRQIKRIDQMGFRMALDDVDSGQNSLERAANYAPYLNRIKFSYIKCLQDGVKPQTIFRFIEAWRDFARENQLDFVIEGIENEQTSLQLKEMGLFLQQGYYFGKPSKQITTNI